MRLAILATLATLAACAEFPEITTPADPAIDALPYPRLVPIAPLLDQADALAASDGS